jgi:predicted RNase H-like HicB family nuclease
MRDILSMSTTTTVNDTVPVVFKEGIDTKETFRIYLQEGQDGWIVVTSPDLAPLVTQGKTEEEAIANAYQAAELLLEESGLNKDFNLLVIDKD